MRYAQIDADNICFAESEVLGEIQQADMVPLTNEEPSPLGKRWTLGGWEAVVPEPMPVVRHISVGAFFDRFGAAKYAILADQNPIAQALVKDASVRKYIDLTRPDLPYGLQMLVDIGHNIDIQAIIEAEIQNHELP